MIINKKYVTVKEASKIAKILYGGKSERTIRYACANKLIKGARKFNNSWMIPYDNLKDYLETYK